MYKESLLEELNSELNEGLNKFLYKNVSESTKDSIRYQVTSMLHAFFCRNNIRKPIPLVIVKDYGEHCYSCGQDYNHQPNSLSITLLDPITKEPYIWENL